MQLLLFADDLMLVSEEDDVDDMQNHWGAEKGSCRS